MPAPHRITGSADLLAALEESDLPGVLAAGRRPAFGLNFVAAVGQNSLGQVVDSLVASCEGGAAPIACGSHVASSCMLNTPKSCPY